MMKFSSLAPASKRMLGACKLLCAASALGLAACQPADPVTEYQLQKLSDKLDSIEQKLNKLPDGAGLA